MYALYGNYVVYVLYVMFSACAGQGGWVGRERHQRKQHGHKDRFYFACDQAVHKVAVLYLPLADSRGWS